MANEKVNRAGQGINGEISGRAGARQTSSGRRADSRGQAPVPGPGPERPLKLTVSEKGCVVLGGLRKVPVAFYKDEWRRILGHADEILDFIESLAAESGNEEEAE